MTTVDTTREVTEYPVLWGREGFVGQATRQRYAFHPTDYTAVEGPHAPHCLNLASLPLPDRDDPAALPLPLMTARSGLRVSVSGRAALMPFVLTNVEADEIHFVQAGELVFWTDYGPLAARAGDFVCLPRAIQYRIEPRETPTLSLVVEIPGAVRPEVPDPHQAQVRRSTPQPRPPGGETTLVVQSFDSVTRYTKPHDPLAGGALVQGDVPVWALALRDIAAWGADTVGPPTPFAGSPHADALLYSLSARLHGGRPPVHRNADYDELIYYFAGPGAYGRVNEPGALTWVPKGIAHHGPTDVVPGGYLAWLLESRSTLRLTSAGLAAASLMETDGYGPFEANRVSAR